jgi:Fur family transcriptional regulator, iron response regulator
MNPDEAARLLALRGITPTQQRVEIAAILLAEPQHVCAEQLMTRINQAGVCVSKATVYNTLGLFARRGLVREVIVDPAKVFYDSNVRPHQHLYHVDSGTLTDIPAHAVDIKGLPELPAGTVVDGVDVIVRLRSTPRKND